MRRLVATCLVSLAGLAPAAVAQPIFEGTQRTLNGSILGSGGETQVMLVAIARGGPAEEFSAFQTFAEMTIDDPAALSAADRAPAAIGVAATVAADPQSKLAAAIAPINVAVVGPLFDVPDEEAGRFAPGVEADDYVVGAPETIGQDAAALAIDDDDGGPLTLNDLTPVSADAQPTPNPIPGAGYLLMTALVGFGLARRRRA